MVLLTWVAAYAAAALGVRNAGASNRTMVGVAIGAVAGAFAGLPELVVGPVLEAIAGEWLVVRKATRAGVAAGPGFIIAIAAKLGPVLGVFAYVV